MFLFRRSNHVSATRKWIYKRFVASPYRTIRKYILGFTPFQAPSRDRVALQDDSPDYIIWGVIDWHFRHQRPQQLARTISATGRRVFYISSNFRADMRTGFELESLDASKRLFQIKLFVSKPTIIYFSAPGSAAIKQLRGGLDQLLAWTGTKKAISIVQHSFWYDIAKIIPNSRLVYDCIDHHRGFGNNSDDVLSLESRLLQDADLVVTTSDWLGQFARKHAKRCILVRNASDYAHFSRKPPLVYKDRAGRKIIGYYGAIASWLDLDLLKSVAARFPDCCVLLVGADTVRAQQVLAQFKNVTFVGEVAYDKLPYYLHSFDVATLPFKINELTLATNPVKVYEYLAAGKPVVSVDLPEIAAFGDLVCSANTIAGFLEGIAYALDGIDQPSDLDARRDFASQQTWHHRAQDLIDGAEVLRADPIISIVVVTFNNLDFTRDCLRSIELFSDYPNLEVIVVDNASNDGSADYLKCWAAEGANRKLILNCGNLGFAAASNQGLSAASGEYLVLLNNDTYVTPGWIWTLFYHLRQNEGIGLIGPVTNRIGNEARVNIKYSNMQQMLSKARDYKRKHLGETFPIRTLAFFCVMMPRHVYNTVGPLDEDFGLGFFEDDDYCRRVEQAGFAIVCAEDVFIHHHLSASFSKLDREARRSLFNENKKKYEARWGTWRPHAVRKRTFGNLYRS